MFDALINGAKSFTSGLMGNASAGAFGAGGKGFLSGAGTALGPGAEFGAAQAAGGAISNGMESVLKKLTDMTPEQQLQAAATLAKHAAPPPLQMLQSGQALQRPQQPTGGYAAIAGVPQAPAQVFRTPLTGGQ